MAQDATGGGFVSMGNGVGSWGATISHFFVTNRFLIMIFMLILVCFAAWVLYYIYTTYLAETAKMKRLKIGKFKVDIRGYLRWFLGRALRRPGTEKR